jgi:hypothetical protein
MMPNRIYDTEMGTFKEMDALMDNVRPDLDAQKLDLDTLNKVYRRMPMYYRFIEFGRITSYKGIEVSVHPLGGELFSTSYTFSCLIKSPNYKKFRRIEFDTIWYALAKAPAISFGVAKRVLDEVSDNRYFRNKGLLPIEDREVDSWRKYAVNVMKMNPNLTDDVRLWLELQ